MNDWELLQDYARHGNESSFQALVDRYLGLVHSVALREVRDAAWAADVAQAVFLLLARRASSLRPGVILAGWLFRTTRFVAARARRADQRRRRREQDALTMQGLHDSSPDDAWKHLEPELDAALACLGATDRHAVLLRFAQGQSHREVGTTLGLSEEAAKKRLNRALVRLRKLLLGRGVSLSVALLATLLADRLVAAPPPSLPATIAANLHVPLAAPLRAARLVQEASRTWQGWVARLSLVLGGVAAVTLGLFLALPALRDRSASAPAAAFARDTPATSRALGSSAAPTSGLTRPNFRTGGGTFRLVVVDADTSRPIADVQVPVNYVAGSDWFGRDDLRTDAQGRCEIPLPRSELGRLDAGAHVGGWENRFFTWRKGGPPLPATYTLRLGHAETLGGRLLSPDQQPIAQAQVWLDYQVSDTSWRDPEEERERLGFMRRILVGTTDARGFWSVTTVPLTLTHGVVEFEHPDFVTATANLRPTLEDANDSVSLARLRARQALTLAEPGFVAMGRLVTRTGEPVPGARVATSWTTEGVTSDVDGRFALGRLPKGDVLLSATATGYAPRKFHAPAGGEAVEINLEPGATLQVRCLDPQGQPIPGASLVLEDGFGDGALGWTGTADTEGWFTWTSAPPERALLFTAYAPGYQYARSFILRTDSTNQVVTLRPAPAVTGRVVDAESGEPIAGFKAIPGNASDPSAWDRSSLSYGTNGAYRMSFEEPGEPAIRIEAAGYLPEVRQPRLEPDGSARCDFHLQPERSLRGIRGQVRTPDGSPAAGVRVALCTLEYGAVLGRRCVLTNRTEGLPSQVTAADGTFAFPPTRVPHTVVAVSLAGFGRARARESDTVRVTLQPFGIIEGDLLRDSTPMPGQRLYLVDPAYEFHPGAVALDVAEFTVTTDASGHFRLTDVPAGDYLLFRDGGGNRLIEPTPITVEAGLQQTVTLGQPAAHGRTVKGTLRLSEAVPVVAWSRQTTIRSLSRVVPSPQPPAGLGADDLRLWRVDWYESADGRRAVRERRQIQLTIADDGSFSARDVPPGDYQLTLDVRPEESAQRHLLEGRATEWSGRVHRRIQVPPPPPGEDEAPVDLGEIEVAIRKNRPE